MANLQRSTAPSKAMLLPDGAPANGIVHLGLGNFHRAHLAIYTAKAVAAAGGEWGIAAFSFRNKTISDEMKSQDLLYSVVDIAPDIQTITIPGIHTTVYAGPDEAPMVIAEIAKDSTKIVTLTVTEAGYKISQKTNGLDLDLAEVKSDLAGTTTLTAIGLIARALILRAQSHRLPITILSCDNLSSNGDRTKQLITEFAHALASDQSQILLEYLTSSVTFPNSMVDRIVPGTEARHIEMAEARLGVHDSTPVPAEPFTMWIVEDHFAAGRPAWEKAGAIFSDEVELFEILKLRLLNGSHSLIAYLGGLAQTPTIPESRFQPYIEAAVRKLLSDELLPTLTVPTGLDVNNYIAQLFSRWSNTVLGDRTSRVGSDGSTKLPQRFAGPAQFHIANGHMPHISALTVAAYLACIAPLNGFDPGPVAAEMKDPSKEKLVAIASASASATEFVATVFESNLIFSPEISALPGFKDQVVAYLQSIIDNGVEATTLKAIAG